MKKLTFKNIRVNRAPGVDASNHLVFDKPNDFSDCINLVTGPNEVGKSTTAKSLQAVLFGGKDFDVVYTIDVDGEKIKGQTVKGQEERLNLHVPVDQGGKSFIMSLEDLLEVKTQDAAERIRKEVYGNVNLDTLDITNDKRNASKTKKAATQRTTCARELNNLLLEHENFPKLEKDLDSKKNEKKELTEEYGQVQALNAIKNNRDAESVFSNSTENPEGYDERISLLQKDDFKQMKELRKKIEDDKKKLASKKDELQKLVAILPHSVIKEEDINRVDKVLTELQATSTSLATKKEELTRKREQVAGNAGKIGNYAREDLDYEQLETQIADDLGPLLTKYREVAAKKSALEKFIKQLDDFDTDPNADTLELHEQGLVYLLNWIGSGASQEGPSNSKKSKMNIITAGICTFLAFSLCFVNLWALLLLIPAILLSITFLIPEKKSPDFSAEVLRNEYQNQFNNLNIINIDDWTDECVKKMIREIQRKISSLQTAEELNAIKDQAKRNLEDAEEEADNADGELNDVREMIGLPEDKTPEIMLALVKALIDWHESSVKAKVLQGEINELESELKADLDSVNESYFKPILRLEATNVSQVRQHLRALRDKKPKQEKHQQLEEEEIPELQKNISDNENLYSAIVKRLKLEHEENPLELVESWEEISEEAKNFFNELDDAKREKERTGKTRDDLLSELPPEKAEVLRNLSDEELNRRINDSEDIIQKRDELTREITELEQKLNDLRDPKELLEAEKKLDDAHAHFQEYREEEISHLVRMRMVELLKKRCQRHASPTLKRASELYSQFTNDQHSLEPDNTGTILKSIADGPSETQALEQLSSGTRIQMLMAVRMAFLEQLEKKQDTRLPLFLDEVLCNSDDERMTAIINTVMEIAKNRQVFYFTAQLDELEKWKALAAKKNPPFEVKELILPLNNTDRLAGILHGPQPLISPLKPEDGESWESYGKRLKIGAMNPYEGGAHDLHIWYMIHDSAVLYSCLQSRIKSWGEFKRRCERIGSKKFCTDIGIDSDTLKKIQSLGECIGTLWSDWWIGRGKPLDHQALKECGITDHYISDVYDRSQTDEITGDAEKLINSLWNDRISGFGPQTINNLKSNLTANGYIKEEPPLTVAELGEELDIYISNSDRELKSFLRSERDWLLDLFSI